jgi:hypothetical protein
VKQKFEFEFEDESATNSISLDEYDDSLEEIIDVSIESNVAVIYANSSALLYLAKIFLKMALCKYSKGFHIHLTKNLDAEEPEILRVILSSVDIKSERKDD